MSITNPTLKIVAANERKSAVNHTSSQNRSHCMSVDHKPWGTIEVNTGSGDDTVNAHVHADGSVTVTSNGVTQTFTPDEAKNLVFNLGDGDDSFTVTSDHPGSDLGFTVNGGAGNDKLVGGNGADNFDGGCGDDYIDGSHGNDRISGGGGDDTLHGSSGDDTIDGGDGADKMYGGNGNDNLFGGAGNDEIHGGDGYDELYGEAGDDHLEGGDDTDSMFGGTGEDSHGYMNKKDRFFQFDVPGVATAPLNPASEEAQAALAEPFQNLNGVDIQYLHDGSVEINTGPGDDQVQVHTNADGSTTVNINGEEINFTAEQSKNLKFDLGDGDDSFITSSASIGGGRYATQQGYTVNGGAGNDFLVGGNGADNIDGGSGDDTIFGAGGDDRLSGGAGADLMHGGNGADIMDGGAGDDEMHGNYGNDDIYGGDGNDSLHGGNGYDELYGQAGDDFLGGGDQSDSMFGGTGEDSFGYINSGDQFHQFEQNSTPDLPVNQASLFSSESDRWQQRLTGASS